MPRKCHLPRIVFFQVCFISFVIFPAIHAFAQSPVNQSSTKSSTHFIQPEHSKDVYWEREGIVSGSPAPKIKEKRYFAPKLLSRIGGSRVVIWVLAQQHLFFGSLVVGVLFLVTLLELKGIFSKERVSNPRYDDYAYEMLRISILIVSLTSILGGIFLFGLLAFYSDLIQYLADVFRPFFLLFGLLVLAFNISIYFYYQTWKGMYGRWRKRFHIGLGLLSNVLGTFIFLLANSWSSFMVSPSGVDNLGRFLGDYWSVLNNPLWIPTNVHRFFSNIVFGTIVMAVYATYHALITTSPEKRTYYDRMGYTAFIATVFSILTLPYGGYWLLRAFHAYRPEMGITLLGGLLTWHGVLLVILLGLLFISINYYLWQRIDLTYAGDQYRSQLKYILGIMIICLLVYITPHTLDMAPGELKAIGGTQHPVAGNYGVESSKQPAVNIMLVCTIWSLTLFWRSRYERTRHPFFDIAIFTLFLGGIINIIFLGTYGYFVPANIRIGLSVPMTMTTLSILLFGILLTFGSISKASHSGFPHWGNLSARGHYTLFFIAVTITWIMGIGGYRRSAVRLHWHVNEILRDNSPWAYTPSIGFVGNVLTLNTLIFWGTVLVLFWLARFKNSILPVNQKAPYQEK